MHTTIATAAHTRHVLDEHQARGCHQRCGCGPICATLTYRHSRRLTWLAPPATGSRGFLPAAHHGSGSLQVIQRSGARWKSVAILPALALAVLQATSLPGSQFTRCGVDIFVIFHDHELNWLIRPSQDLRRKQVGAEARNQATVPTHARRRSSAADGPSTRSSGADTAAVWVPLFVQAFVQRRTPQVAS